ncbi:conserved hypothetical protein [Talaromyces stipitatus ATCC 10500]|nr:uncharacterized protein TSTA_037620 [Talaromyces stipitatus ATCC 10500]EED20544.1 conserved hypothetical protein [Talaromyces stipitatus ATCC 10500]
MELFASQSETVTILKSQYEDLLCLAQQFENLKGSLLRGGVSTEDLDVLVHGTLAPHAVDEKHAQNPYNRSYQPSNGVSLSTRIRPFESASTNTGPNHSHSHEESIQDYDDDALDEVESQTPPDQFNDNEQQTIEIRNLPERCTYLDITKSIRGGALVQIYLRYTERIARVSFVEAAAAREFLARGKRAGVYIRNQKVDLSWSNSQFILRPYIKQSILHNGATRNLIIHNANPNITSALIREHLEHIHNLIIVDIRFNHSNSSVCICTNSVHNAMFARSCMRSRAAYKGMRIDFGVDECAAPYSELSATAAEYHVSASTQGRVWGRRDLQKQGTRARSVSNRFGLLSLESDGGTDSEEEESRSDS